MTVRWSRLSFALKTSPIPPAPMGERISQGPSMRPGGRDITCPQSSTEVLLGNRKRVGEGSQLPAKWGLFPELLNRNKSNNRTSLVTSDRLISENYGFKNTVSTRRPGVSEHAEPRTGLSALHTLLGVSLEEPQGLLIDALPRTNSDDFDVLFC